MTPWTDDTLDCSQSGSSVHGDSLSKNTGVVWHALFQGTSWPRLEPGSPVLQVDSTVCLPAPNKMGLDVYRRWVICLLLFPSTVYFASNIWVLFLFPWTLCRMEVLSKRKTLSQREVLSGIAVKILSCCQFIQNTRSWLFVFNYIYIRKNKWLASFCSVCCCCCC